MKLLDILLYKNDEISGEKRLSKTKIISLVVFVIMFSYSLFIPTNTVTDSFIFILAAIIFGLIFSVPVFILGWLIAKFLNRGNKNNRQNTVIPEPETATRRLDLGDNVKSNENIPCPYDNASRFKNAIDNNDSVLAENILSDWDESDANYLYARIIFDGMPPSSVDLSQLKTWFDDAKSKRACDNSLRAWFEDTALQVINMH